MLLDETTNPTRAEMPVNVVVQHTPASSGHSARIGYVLEDRMNPEDNLTPPDVREVECYGCAGEGKVVRFSGIFTCKRCGGDGTLTGSAADEQAREIDDQARLDEERGK